MWDALRRLYLGWRAVKAYTLRPTASLKVLGIGGLAKYTRALCCLPYRNSAFSGFYLTHYGLLIN
jgi:hypothetical protein